MLPTAVADAASAAADEAASNRAAVGPVGPVGPMGPFNPGQPQRSPFDTGMGPVGPMGPEPSQPDSGGWLGGAANAFRTVVPQGVRDVVGDTINESGLYGFLNAASGPAVAQSRPDVLAAHGITTPADYAANGWQYPGQPSTGTLGTQLQSMLGNIPVVGPEVSAGANALGPGGLVFGPAVAARGVAGAMLGAAAQPVVSRDIQLAGGNQQAQDIGGTVANIAGNLAGFTGERLPTDYTPPPNVLAAINASGDTAALRAADVPRETSNLGVMQQEALPNEPGVFAPATRIPVSGGDFTPEEIAAQDAHIQRSIGDDPNLSSAIAKVQDNIAAETALRAPGGTVEQEIAAGRARQAAGAQSALDLGMANGASLDELANAAAQGTTTGSLRQTFAPGANLTAEEDRALARLIVTSPPLQGKALAVRNLLPALRDFLNGGTIYPYQRQMLSDLLGADLEVPHIGPRGAELPNPYPANMEPQGLWNPDAMYRQPTTANPYLPPSSVDISTPGGVATGAQRIGETPPIPRTGAEQTASAARYSEAVTPEGAAQAIPNPTGEPWNPIPTSAARPTGDPGVQGSMLPQQALENGPYTRIDPATGQPMQGGRVESTAPPLAPRISPAEQAELQTPTGAAQGIDPNRVNATAAGAFETTRGATQPEMAGTPPPPNTPGAIKQSFDAFRENPWTWYNDTVRGAQTTGDFASPLRLLQTFINYPKIVGKAWWDILRTGNDYEQVVGATRESVDALHQADPMLPSLSEMYDPQQGWGLRLHDNADIQRGALGRLTGERINILRTFLDSTQPQILQQSVQNHLAAGDLSRFQLFDTGVRSQFGDSARLITGQGVGKNPFAPWVEFSSWFQSQPQLILKAFQRGTYSGAMARQQLIRYFVTTTALTEGINALQGIAPWDKRGWYEGAPVVNIPAAARGPAMFGQPANTQWDMNKISEFVTHQVRAARAAYEGATPAGNPTMGERVGGALHGVGVSEGQYALSIASPAIKAIAILAQVAAGQDVKDAIGQPIRNLKDFAATQWSPFNLENAINGARSPVTQFESGIGASIHEPSVVSQVKTDPTTYSQLAPDDQFTARKQAAWNNVMAGGHGALSQYPNEYAWAQAEAAKILPTIRAAKNPDGTPWNEGQVQNELTSVMGKQPVYKDYLVQRDLLTTRWVIANPDLALKQWNADASLRWDDPAKWSPTKEQRDLMLAYQNAKQQSVGAKR